MGAEQAVFSREEGFFREEHEDGVVLQGTVQSVKEKDGTLEVVLRDCAMEGKDGESGEKLRRVLCYLDVNKTGEAAEAVSLSFIHSCGLLPPTMISAGCFTCLSVF